MQAATENGGITNGRIINGKEYREVNGTSYDPRTPQAVIDALEAARASHKRIRVFYGDAGTGFDWKEENDVQGYVGRSTGSIKIPLLIHSKRSTGGPGLLDHCIVKITIDKRVVYQHPTYRLGPLEIVELADLSPEDRAAGYVEGVNDYVERIAHFKKPGQADKYIQFLQGTRNSK